MTKTGESTTHEFFTDLFEGQPVRFAKNKLTQEVTINAEDAAQCMGYRDLEDMMSDDAILDEANRIHQETGVFPIATQDMDTEEEKIDFFAKTYSEEIDQLNSAKPEEDDWESHFELNSTMSGIQLICGTTEKVIDGSTQPEQAFHINIWQADVNGVILSREDLQRMIDILDANKIAE